MMMTKLEMPANGSGTGTSTAAMLTSGGAPTTSRLISSSAVPMKVDETSVAQQSTSGVSLLAGGARYRIPNASPIQENGTMESDDLGPVSRDRCNTWPLRRPQLDINAQTSPLIHEQIPEEENDLYDSAENVSNGHLGANSTAGLMGSPESGAFSPGMSSPVPCGAASGQVPPSSAGSDTSDPGTGAPGSNKKSTTRRNAWGNMSYADLITQAIVSSPEKRLTLSQVYEWMVQNVPYFRDKGDSNSSAGWKDGSEFEDDEGISCTPQFASSNSVDSPVVIAFTIAKLKTAPLV